jgi:hypothetical protein
VLRTVVRMDLDPSADNPYLGWRPLVTSHDVAAVWADGPLVCAVVVARRHTPTRYTASTFLTFHAPLLGPAMWAVVRPVHLRVERHLLAAAARAVTERRVPTVAGRSG